MKPGKIIHLLVACILLVSTIGVVINKHYSGGELFSTALFVEAQSCCVTACCHQEPMSDCAEESDYFRLVADYIIPVNSETDFDDIPNYITYSYSGGHLYSIYIDENLTPLVIKPPPKIIDIPILFHSLLI